MLTMCLSIWSLRLTLYLLYRNWARGEDARLKKQRERSQCFACRVFVQHYLNFFSSTFYMGYPVLLTNVKDDTRTTVLTFLGVAVWFVGMSIEAIADS